MHMKSAALFTTIRAIVIGFTSAVLLAAETQSPAPVATMVQPQAPVAEKQAPDQTTEQSVQQPDQQDAQGQEEVEPADAEQQEPNNQEAEGAAQEETAKPAQQIPSATEQKAQPVKQPAVKQPAASPEQATVPQIPEPPSPVEPAAQAPASATEQKKNAVQEGIDTLDQEGGNWLKKRQALEKTIDTIERIKNIFNNILKSRVDFMVKRNKIDREFDLFANSVGFELGDLSQQLQNMQEELEKERKTDGELDEQEREALAEVEQKIEDLKALTDQLKKITDLDAAIDEAVMQVEKEINVSNNYQMQAWQNFQTIKQVLNDERAEELYLQTEGLYKNLQAIYSYINNQLMNYFNTVVDQVSKGIGQTKDGLAALKEKGVVIERTLDELEAKRRTEEIDKACQEREEEAQKKEAKPAPKPSKNFFVRWWDSVIDMFSGTWNWLTSFFIAKKKK